MLIALVKSNGMPRPVQIPDICRAITTSCLCSSVFKSASALSYFEHGVSGTCADRRLSQFGLSKDGCLRVAKEIQRTLEYSNVLKPADPSPATFLSFFQALIGRSCLIC